jgi:hypothetical protein
MTRSDVSRCPRLLARITALLLGAAAVSCTTSRQVTPWFRVDLYRPFMDQPVLIGEQPHETAFVRRGDRWVQVSDGRVFATPTSDGRAVLFAAGLEWRVARDTGEIAPLEVDCSFPALHPTKPLVYCARCANEPPMGRCKGTNVAELDLSGKVVRAWTSPEPTDDGTWTFWLVGVLADESVVLAVYGGCTMLAVGPGGTTRLGSGPKTKAGCAHHALWGDALRSRNAVPLVLSGGNTW